MAAANPATIELPAKTKLYRASVAMYEGHWFSHDINVAYAYQVLYPDRTVRQYTSTRKLTLIKILEQQSQDFFNAHYPAIALVLGRYTACDRELRAANDDNFEALFADVGRFADDLKLAMERYGLDRIYDGWFIPVGYRRICGADMHSEVMLFHPFTITHSEYLANIPPRLLCTAVFPPN